MKAVLQAIVAIGAVVVIILGAYHYIESRYALKTQLEMIEKRLDIKIMNDYMQQTQNRIWFLEDRLAENPGDITSTEEIRRLTHQKTQYENQLKILRSSISSK